jgi:aminoglycoside phosphotransferase (APT) family kinase protein
LSAFDEPALRTRIEAFLSKQTGEEIKVEHLFRYAVGFSWLTYGLTLTGLPPLVLAKTGKGQASDPNTKHEIILRLGPDHGLFAPYSALPQALAMKTLHGSAVPVPAAYWHDDNHVPLGAPFLFCEKVAGSAVLPWASSSLAPLKDEARLSLAHDFIDAIAALHCHPWREHSFASLGLGITRENAAEKQISFWKQCYERWAMRAYPMFEWGLHWLEQRQPVAPQLSIVHGDYRTGNFLEINGRISSILDWELTHVGDPHEDLAWASLPMYMGGTKFVSRLIEPEKFFSLYQARVPFALNEASLKFYRVFSLVKLAATHMAAARCFEEGRFNDLRMPAMGSQIIPVLRQMEKAIDSVDR